MPLSKQLARIVELAQVKVKCPCTCHLKVVFHQDSGCPECQSTGYVPDPRYKGLGEALAERCRGGYHTSYCVCHGSGRILRTEWQQGELAGVLTQYAQARWEESLHRDHFWGELAWGIARHFGKPDCNEQAAQVVLEAMQKEVTHATNPSAT